MSFFDLLKAFFPLILMVGLLYAVLRYVKGKSFSLNAKNDSPVKIKVMSSQLIMPKKYISVVRLNDKYLVLGVSENSISLLKEIDHIPVPEDENKPVINEKNNFLDMLKKNMAIR